MFLQGNWAYPIIKKINPYMDLLFMPFPTYKENQARVVAKIDATLGFLLSVSIRKQLKNFWTMYFQKMSVNIMQIKPGLIPV